MILKYFGRNLGVNKRLYHLLPAGQPRYVRCYDNGGETADRYTVVFSGRYTHQTGGEHWYLGMSELPYHPQGVGQHGSHAQPIDAVKGWAPVIGRKCHLGVRIPFADLPADCKRCVMVTYCDLWGLK